MQVGSMSDCLTERLYFNGYKIAVETNGMFEVTTPYFHHITVSPKTISDKLNIHGCSDFKLIYPKYVPHNYLDWIKEKAADCNKYVQPLWGDKSSLEKCIEFVKKNDDWKLSLQTHKYIGVE